MRRHRKTLTYLLSSYLACFPVSPPAWPFPPGPVHRSTSSLRQSLNHAVAAVAQCLLKARHPGTAPEAQPSSRLSGSHNLAKQNIQQQQHHRNRTLMQLTFNTEILCTNKRLLQETRLKKNTEYKWIMCRQCLLIFRKLLVNIVITDISSSRIWSDTQWVAIECKPCEMLTQCQEFYLNDVINTVATKTQNNFFLHFFLDPRYIQQIQLNSWSF